MPGCHAERSEASLYPSDVILSAAKDLRGGVTSSLFAALTAVPEDLLNMLISKCLQKQAENRSRKDQGDA
ncbi:MAG TPA: hypothetical protein VJQ26_06730 [Ktedonobacteraceae bacterium]|nr:hypothetical protein [Ktedonobacteraceae bacterium]